MVTRRRRRCRSVVILMVEFRRRRGRCHIDSVGCHCHCRCKDRFHDFHCGASAVVMSSVAMMISCVNIGEADHTQGYDCCCQPDPFSFVVLHSFSPSLEFCLFFVFFLPGFMPFTNNNALEYQIILSSNKKMQKNPVFLQKPDFQPQIREE